MSRPMSSTDSSTKGSHILDQFLLKGKTIVITGGGRGLGLNFGIGLAQVGANIACIDVHEKPHDDFNTLSSYGGKAAYYR
jgi:sorbose reductase